MGTRIRLAVRPFLGEATMTLPANAVYYATAGVVLAIVLAWIVGYRAGDASRAKQLAPFTNPPPLRVQEPNLGAATPGSSSASPNATPTATSTPMPPVEANRSAQLPGAPATTTGPAPRHAGPAEVEASATAGPLGASDVLLAQGWSRTDPREIGLNYMYLPIMTRTEAERAVTFLNANSLEVMAVPLQVDRRGSKANNPPPADARYRVVLRRGLTGEEYSQGVVKQDLQAKALKLGQVWKRDNRGTTDFSAVSWEKLVESR